LKKLNSSFTRNHMDGKKGLTISLTILLLLTCSKLFSQIPQEELMKFYKLSIESKNGNLFKDSTALYAFNVQISVDKNRGYIPTITNNNETLASQLPGLRSLMEYDYKGLMGENECVKFILPIAIIIFDSKYNNTIEPYLGVPISYMFYASTKEDDNIKIVYLEPIIVEVSRKIYD
jgi:hypothetical protein